MKKMLATMAVASLATAGTVYADGAYNHIIDLAGVTHNDGFGNPINTIINLDLAALAGVGSGNEVSITGVYWEGNLSTIGASYADEANIAFLDSSLNFAGLNLAPGAGLDDPAPNGVDLAGGLKLEEAQIPDVVLADGILNLEFYDSFVDNPGAPDAIWNSGTLRIQYNAIPAPAALALLGLAGLAGTRRRRG